LKRTDIFVYRAYDLYLDKGSEMKRVFLLGGYDLEMLEIRRMLERHKENFIDKHLKWGAQLSCYKDELNNEDEFIGIELEPDIETPKYYIEIDHHGEKRKCKSSLEQVAALLNVELNRWQKLVAANDVHYIIGLKELAATQEEIESVRAADRRAQGISEDDEHLAQESLSLSQESHIIYSKTSYFSAVSDRVFNKFTHYVIYNERKVVFYGYKIEKVISFLENKNLDTQDYYYGGSDFGFVGVKENILSSEKIKSLIEDFKYE